MHMHWGVCFVSSSNVYMHTIFATVSPLLSSTAANLWEWMFVEQDVAIDEQLGGVQLSRLLMYI